MAVFCWIVKLCACMCMCVTQFVRWLDNVILLMSMISFEVTVKLVALNMLMWKCLQFHCRKHSFCTCWWIRLNVKNTLKCINLNFRYKITLSRVLNIGCQKNLQCLTSIRLYFKNDTVTVTGTAGVKESLLGLDSWVAAAEEVSL